MDVAAAFHFLFTAENLYITPSMSALTFFLRPLHMATISLLGIFTFSALAQDPLPNLPPLTDSQLAAIKKQLDELEATVKNVNLQKNGNAEQVFREASSDPKKALELYLKSYQAVNFESIGKSDKDFRDWEEGQEGRFEMDSYLSSLQLQLLYLSLSTRAAQQEDISSIFGDLTKYVGQLQTLEQPPHYILNENVANTVFAEVYNLDEALTRSGDDWELNPMNVGGIYEKTILPFLREKAPEKLDSAWNSRIQQEAALAQLFLKFEDEMERFVERNDGMGRGRGDLQRMAQFVRNQALDAAKFQTEAYPALQWARAKDQFKYVNRAMGAKAMLDHVQANLKHSDAERWIDELAILVAQSREASSGT